MKQHGNVRSAIMTRRRMAPRLHIQHTPQYVRTSAIRKCSAPSAGADCDERVGRHHRAAAQGLRGREWVRQANHVCKRLPLSRRGHEWGSSSEEDMHLQHELPAISPGRSATHNTFQHTALPIRTTVGSGLNSEAGRTTGEAKCELSCVRHAACSPANVRISCILMGQQPALTFRAGM